MASRVLTVSSICNCSNNRYVPTPLIRLQGKWLQKLNFSKGDKVKVITNKEQIIIKVIKD